MTIKPPSDYFNNPKKTKNMDDKGESPISIFESFKSASENIDAYFNEKRTTESKNEINQLKEKISKIENVMESSITKEDIEKITISQLIVVEDSINKIQNNLKNISDKSVSSIKLDLIELKKSFNELIGEEFPKYKNIVKNYKIELNERYEKLEEDLNNTILEINDFLNEKYEELSNKLNGINQNAISEIKEDFAELDESVSKIVTENIPSYEKFLKNYEKRSESILSIFNDRINNLSDKVEIFCEKEQTLIEKVNEKIEEVDSIKDFVLDEIQNNNSYKDAITKKVSDLEINVIKNEYHVKNIEKIEEKVEKLQTDFVDNYLNIVENYIEKNYKDVISLREQIFEEIEKLPIGDIQNNIQKIERKIKYIDEIYKNIKPEQIVQDVIKESILTDSPSTKNSDPLTPLDKKFVTFDQLQQHYKLFINRIQQQLSSLGGGGETRLQYLDDIVGIATNASFYDGKYLKYDHQSQKFVFDVITTDNIEISEQNIIYVAKDGDDSNSGSLTRPKLTIKAAIEIAKREDVIRVAPGTYIEDNPLVLPDQITVMGHSLRETTIIPLNDDKDLFHVGNGNYVAEMSYKGSLKPGRAIFAFDPVNQRYIDQSPYIQNCTNFIPDSIGMKIDGNNAIGPLKSMVLDSYTQYNQGGIGVSITNEAYAQLVSLFTICNDIAVYCGSGGACDLTNSNSSFGNYGLVADGLSPKKFVGVVTSVAPENSNTFIIDVNSQELQVVDAEYDNLTGRVKIVTEQPHNFNVGVAVTIAGLGFTCPFEPGIRYYPSGESGYVFSVETVAPGRYLDASNLISANKSEIIEKSLSKVAVSSTDFYFEEDSQTNSRSRYYDATRLIQKNRQEIIDKSLASIAVGFPTNFVFPTDSNINQRYYDASNLIVRNKQEIVDKSLASIAIGFPTGFYFPGESETNSRSRYYDASRLIQNNKQEIVDKSLASIAINYPNFYFPGDSQTNERSRYFDSYRLIQKNRSLIVDKVWQDISSTYPSFTYSETKCRRDIGFFIDAISTDVFTGGNNYARSFVLQYFDGTNQIGIAASERVPSVYAFNRSREYMKQAITNTLPGAEYNDFTITNDPLTGSNTDPASCSNVQENINTLTEIVTVSIGAGNTTSLPSSPNYGVFNLNSVGIGTTITPGGVKCARDLSYLVEAIATDIFTGGNKYSRDFTLQYFNNGSPISNGLLGEEAQSVYAFNSLRDYAKKAITNQLNYKEVGISSGTAIYGGPGIAITVYPSGNPNACADVQTNINTLVEIVTNVIGSGSTSYLSTFNENLGISTTNTCARDLGYLVEAIATDVFTGGNKYSRDFTLQYFNPNGDFLYLNGENVQSVYAFNTLGEYSRKAITNQLNYKNLLVNSGVSSIGSGGDLIPVLPSGNPDACADVQYSISTLVGIVTNVIGTASTSILSTFNENLGITTTNICARDLGYLVDALSTDVFTGGNRYIRDFCEKYYDANGDLDYIGGENVQSSYAFNSVGEYAKKAITNQLNYKEVGISSGPANYSLGGLNIPVLLSGSPDSCADVQSNIDNLITIVTNVIGDDNLDFLDTFNINFGIFQTNTYQFYDILEEVVNSVANDLIGYGNEYIVESTKKYYNSLDKDVLTVALNSSRDYMNLAINNQLIVRDFTIAEDPLTGSNYDINSCADVQQTINTEIEIITTSVQDENLNSLPNVSLASTFFTVDVGIATQPHYYNGGGTVKLNIVRPYDGQALYFNELFYTVKTLKIINGGSGYTELPTVTIDPPQEPWGIPAQAVPLIENGVLVGVDMVSNGRGYKSPPKVTISSGINNAVAIAEIVPEYYTIQKASEIVNGLTIITLNENVPFEVGIGTVANFFKQSRVLATGHSFEFIGSGTDIASCLPFSGGVPIDENETDSRNGGLVVYSSTNQSGNFKIGDGVTINQNTGSITGNAYTKSLFSTMTPFILALGGGI